LLAEDGDVAGDDVAGDDVAGDDVGELSESSTLGHTISGVSNHVYEISHVYIA
jgi:hypothetical protein